jgi:RimJ/RimL family protein N-acetyltransferase
MKLIEIGENGDLSEEVVLNDFLREVLDATVTHYRRTCFVPPWIGYVGLEDGVPVSVAGYKSQPIEGKVEIAYGTVPGHEGKGHATTLAAELVRVARLRDERLTIVAQTLPEENASGSILKKLGFQMMRTVDHPDDGLVWEWELPADVPLPGSESA